MSFDDVMKAADNGPRTDSVTLCFNSDLDREYRELEVELVDAERAEARAAGEDGKTNRRVAEKPRSHQIAARIAAIREEHPTAFYEFVLRALPKPEWLKLRSDHPPRDSHKDEDAGMFNSDTFPQAAVEACLVDPEPTLERLEWLTANLTTGDWNRLSILAWSLNEGTREAPKAERALAILSGNATG